MTSGRNGFPRLLAAAVLCLAGCMPSLPQPFHPDDIPRLTEPGVRAGLTVAPVEGAADGTLFAEAIADALADQDIAASTEPIAGPSYHLIGRAFPEGDGIRLEWEVEDATRGFAGGAAQGIGPDKMPAWKAGDPRLYRQLARSAASEIAGFLAESAMGTPEQPLILIPEVTGAPGDGRRTLQRSMAYVLDKRGLKTTESETPDAKPALVLQGVMKVEDKGKISHVEIAWTLTRADGTALGNVAQANDVPKGLLDGAWGDIAFAIADAAAGGIADLVVKSPDAAPRAQR
jgi:hypothetical protein